MKQPEQRPVAQTNVAACPQSVQFRGGQRPVVVLDHPAALQRGRHHRAAPSPTRGEGDEGPDGGDVPVPPSRRGVRVAGGQRRLVQLGRDLVHRQPDERAAEPLEGQPVDAAGAGGQVAAGQELLRRELPGRVRHAVQEAQFGGHRSPRQ